MLRDRAAGCVCLRHREASYLVRKGGITYGSAAYDSQVPWEEVWFLAAGLCECRNPWHNRQSSGDVTTCNDGSSMNQPHTLRSSFAKKLSHFAAEDSFSVVDSPKIIVLLWRYFNLLVLRSKHCDTLNILIQVFISMSYLFYIQIFNKTYLWFCIDI